MASKRKITKEAKSKSSFRASSVWKDFRKRKYDIQGGKDWITLRKLSKAYHTHHCNLNASEYENLENEGNFIAVNHETHKVLHWALRYVKMLHSMEIIDRLYEEIKREAIINGFIDEDE